MRYEDPRPRPPYSGEPAMYYPDVRQNRPYPYYDDRPVTGPYAEEERRGRHSQQPVRGRIVKSFDDILPNEIPMDGEVSYFPLPDGSAIMGKMWTKDGRLIPVKYVPEPEPVNQDVERDTSNHVNLEAMSSRLDQLSAIVVDLYDKFTSYIASESQPVNTSKQKTPNRQNQNKEDENK